MNSLKFLTQNTINFLLLFFGFFLIFFIIWVIKVFGKDVYYIEIAYNIYINYDGIKNSPKVYKIDFILYTIYPSIFLSITTIAVRKKIKEILSFAKDKENNKYKIFCKNLFENKYLKIFFFNYYIFFIYCLLFFLLQFKFFEYFEKNAKYEDYPYIYNNPFLVKYKEPKDKKNLILFYVESLEYNVNKLSKNPENNPIKLINEIEGKNIYDFKHAPASSFSIAGVLSSQCSMPFYATVAFNIKDIPKEKLFCLSDVLSKHDYEQIFYISVDKQFQQFDIFKEIHNYKVHDVNIIKEDFKNNKKYHGESAWGDGVYDDVLLEHAKLEIIKMHKSGKNFNFTIINTDTHHPYGHSPRCSVGNTSAEIEKIYWAYRCTSGFLKKFFDDLDNAGVLDDTVVVIMGDHTAYGAMVDLKSRSERDIYFKMNTDKEFKRSKMNHYDVAPTILDEMGFLPDDNKHYGFGVSLFEDQNKFNYDSHYEIVMNKDILSAFYMRRLLEFSPKPSGFVFKKKYLD